MDGWHTCEDNWLLEVKALTHVWLGDSHPRLYCLLKKLPPLSPSCFLCIHIHSPTPPWICYPVVVLLFLVLHSSWVVLAWPYSRLFNFCAVSWKDEHSPFGRAKVRTKLKPTLLSSAKAAIIFPLCPFHTRSIYLIDTLLLPPSRNIVMSSCWCHHLCHRVESKQSRFIEMLSTLEFLKSLPDFANSGNAMKSICWEQLWDKNFQFALRGTCVGSWLSEALGCWP